jgi:hypothetical protein
VAAILLDFSIIRLKSTHLLCLRTLTSSYISRLFISRHSIIFYLFSHRWQATRGRVAEPKKKKIRQQKEWERVLAVPDTQGQPQRGIRISEGTQGQGSNPRVSSIQSSRLNSSSSHVAQAEGTSQQSRQIHLPHWPGQDLRHEEVTLSLSRHLVRGELPWRSSQRESSRHTTHRSPEVHK